MTTYLAADIAAWFLRKANADAGAQIDDITNMKLQKLVFFSQLVAVCTNDGTPIHREPSLAWDYGPVVFSLYERIRKIGKLYLSIEDPAVSAAFQGAEGIGDPDAVAILEAVWGKFRNWTAVQLSMLTHRRNSPWAVTYNADRYGVIPLEVMRERKFGDAYVRL